MGKMWEGRFAKALDSQADDFNSSIHFDCRMFRQDIQGSVAHATMLAAKGIIDAGDAQAIIAELGHILADLDSGALSIDFAAEDIHMFVEAELTKRLGDVGKKLHTARSRNDQVAVDIRLYLRDEAEGILQQLQTLLDAILFQAKQHKQTIMPGYTHLQRAQPITFAHHLLAYGMMFTRDMDRIKDAVKRMNVSPLGSCALAGTTYDTDREMTAKALGFDGIALNSIDGVSDRDFCVELLSAFATVMMHLSRFSEEVILWASWEFKFIELDDSYTTGSSIMPQKKNPDIAELVRGKTGRVYGDLMAMLTVLKGLPLAYNKDMQEDKEAIFDAIDTVKQCLTVFPPMIRSMKALPENMMQAAQKGFINATDLADYLVKKGMPFRTAYKIVGQIVAYCIANHQVLEQLSLEEYRQFEPRFEQDVYEQISLQTCVEKRISAGGTGLASVEKQIAYLEQFLS
ncbi:MAG: argininosuccinate lyase [Ruminococcaceae bacterium]|nr:argininosuccinate lyase [Oscillospiraceae bacterium]